MGALNYYQRMMSAKVNREPEPALPELTDIDRAASVYSVTCFSESGVRSLINVLAYEPDQAIVMARARWAFLRDDVAPDARIQADRISFQGDNFKRAILSFECPEEVEIRKRGRR